MRKRMRRIKSPRDRFKANPVSFLDRLLESLRFSVLWEGKTDPLEDKLDDLEDRLGRLKKVPAFRPAAEWLKDKLDEFK